MAQASMAEKSKIVAAEPPNMVTMPSSLSDEEKDVSATVSSVQPSVPFNSPYEWPLALKVAMALIVSLGQLVTLMSASMMAPALPQIGHDLHMGPTEVQITFSVYLLGLALGPFLIGPASEVFGRKPVWVTCFLWYCFWNAMCPVGKNAGLMVVGRLLAGMGASCGTTLSGPIVADMFTKENRGKSIALAAVFPYLGPALGPIVGGVVSQKVSWPWLFWVLSIFGGVVVAVGILVIRESYMPVLLRRHQRNIGGQRREPFLSIYPELLTRCRTALDLPLRLLFRRPVIIVLSFLVGLEFGIYILWLSVYATLFIDSYHETATISSLHYIAIALGAWIAAQAGGPILDLIFRRMKARRPNQEPLPEYRIPLLVIGVLICPVGLFWAGWSAQARSHWIMVDIGSVIFTIGGFVTAQAVLAYLLDEFQKSAASANAAARFLSNVFGFSFPLFAPQLYQAMGYGWGTTLLGCIWVVLSVPLTGVLWYKGAELRAVGRREEES